MIILLIMIILTNHFTTTATNSNYCYDTLAPAKRARPYWLGQAGIVHIGFGQRVLTVVCEIRKKKPGSRQGAAVAEAEAVTVAGKPEKAAL